MNFNPEALPLVVVAALLSLWGWKSRFSLMNYADRVVHLEWSEEKRRQVSKLVLIFPAVAFLVVCYGLFGIPD